MNMWK